MRRTLGPDKAVQGNLDPAALFAAPEELRRQIDVVLSEGRIGPGPYLQSGAWHLAGHGSGCRRAAHRSRPRAHLTQPPGRTVNDFAPTAAAWFRDLQARICASFEAFEDSARFTVRPWSKPEGHRLRGGGESRLMRGAVFEKVGVNFSHVFGSFPPQFRAQVAGAEESEGRFTACGVSLVAHMDQPVCAGGAHERALSVSPAAAGSAAARI